MLASYLDQSHAAAGGILGSTTKLWLDAWLLSWPWLEAKPSWAVEGLGLFPPRLDFGLVEAVDARALRVSGGITFSFNVGSLGSARFTNFELKDELELNR